MSGPDRIAELEQAVANLIGDVGELRDRLDAQRAAHPADDPDTVFARRLREVRLASGRTQQQVALLMAVVGFPMHQTAIAKIEAMNRSVTVGEAFKLAQALGVDLAELVSDPDTPAPAQDHDPPKRDPASTTAHHAELAPTRTHRAPAQARAYGFGKDTTG